MTRTFNVFALQHQSAQDEAISPDSGNPPLRLVPFRQTEDMPLQGKATIPIATGFKRPVPDVTRLF